MHNIAQELASVKPPSKETLSKPDQHCAFTIDLKDNQVERIYTGIHQAIELISVLLRLGPLSIHFHIKWLIY